MNTTPLKDNFWIKVGVPLIAVFLLIFSFRMIVYYEYEKKTQEEKVSESYQIIEGSGVVVVQNEDGTFRFMRFDSTATTIIIKK